MKFHWMKIISLAAIAMVRGQNNEISFFDERERERGGGRRDCPTFVENICNLILWCDDGGCVKGDKRWIGCNIKKQNRQKKYESTR